MIPKNEEERQFREERRTGLGGSDIGAMYSLNYGCARALQYEKRGVVPDYPKEESAPMERGKLLEPVAIELYKRRTSRRAVADADFYRHENYSWMLVHPDGMILPDSDDESAGVLEIKVLGWRSFSRQRKEGLNEEYILQLQHSMAVTGCTWGSFGILCLEPWQFLWFDVQRDEELIKKLIEDEAAFWGKVQNGPWIDRLHLPDPRCTKCPWRRTCQGEVLLTVSGADIEELPRDESLLEKVQKLDEAKQLVKEAEELEAEASEEVKAALGERLGAMMPGYRVYYRSYSETRYDTLGIKAQEKKDPFFRNLMERFKKTSIRRPLRIFATGD